MKLKTGQMAPDFTLKSHLDKDVTLSNFRGKTVMLEPFQKRGPRFVPGKSPHTRNCFQNLKKPMCRYWA